MRSWFATVRVRTTVLATLVVTAALVIGAVLLLVVQRRALVDGLEQNARDRAIDVAALAKRRALPKKLTATKEDDVFTQVVDSAGNVISTSQNLRGEPPVVNFEPPGRTTVLVTRTVEPLDGRFRVAARRVPTHAGRVTVYAG